MYSAGVQALGRAFWPLLRTASCQALHDFAVKHQLLAKGPEVGDVFLVWYPTRERFGHTGIVTSHPTPDGYYSTIEGNTNPGGSREGYGVFERSRNVKLDDAYVRWTLAL